MHALIFLILGLWPALAMAQSNVLLVDDFNNSPLGAFPVGWGLMRDSDKKLPNYYTVREEEGVRFLHAEAYNTDIIIGKEFRWELKDYPVMSWRWRVHALPVNAHELNNPGDSAAAIYVIFSQNFFKVPKSIKYVWSTTMKQGEIGRRDKIGRPWIIVVNSGSEQLGEWITISRNLIDDFKMTHGSDPADRPLYIGIMSDSDGSQSTAIADYDYIRLEPVSQ